jgi:hypothetical protein
MTVKDLPADRFWIHAGRLSPIPWFDLGVLYAVLLAVAAVDLAIVVTWGFEIVSGPLWNDLAFALLFLVVGAIYAATGRSSSIASLLFVVASLVMAGPVGLVLDFTTKAMGNPFADADLAGWDRSLGLDWVAYERWFSSHPILSFTSGAAYSGSTLVLFLALIVLGVLGHLRRMVRLAVATSLTASVCIAIGGFLPAVGPHRFYGFADGGKAYWVGTIIRVVTQQPHLIVLNGQPPLTTFPSFHTAVAVLAVMACWRIPRFGILFGLFNLYWALAIPVWGSHYFTDMIVGAVIAAAGYWVAILVLLPGARWEAKAC